MNEAFDAREYMLADDPEAQLERRGYTLFNPGAVYPRYTKELPNAMSVTLEKVVGEFTVTVHKHGAYLVDILHLKLEPLDVAMTMLNMLEDGISKADSTEAAEQWVSEFVKANTGLREADEFDPREYLLTVDTNTDAIAEKLVKEFGFTEGPRAKRGAMKNVRSFWTKPSEQWRGQLSLTRTYVGDEKNQTWAVDWYPYNVGGHDPGGPGHIHTSGPQHKLLDFLSYFHTSLQTGWMTNKQAIRQAAADKGFDTTYIDRSMESQEFDPAEYLAGCERDEIVVLNTSGFEPDPDLPGNYIKTWPLLNDFGVGMSVRKVADLAAGMRIQVDVHEPNGAARLGEYTVPCHRFEDFLYHAESAVSRIMDLVQRPGFDMMDGKDWADVQDTWDAYFSKLKEAEEPFDAREYMLAGEQGEYELRKWVTEQPATMATVTQPGPDEYFLDVRRQDGKSQRFGPFRRDQIRLFNREWHGFRYAGWAAGPSVTDRDKLFSIFDSEDFDPRDYLLSAPADYVVKWTFGPPKPDQRLYRYTRINGQTSEESALREWQAKMERDWGWRVGDDKKPHLVKVTRAVIQDRPVQEADEFDPRAYVLAAPAIACDKCGADLQAPNAIDRVITFSDGKTTVIQGHSGPEREWENDSGFDPQYAQRTIGEIVDIQTVCAKCQKSLREAVEDFDPRNYFLTLPSAVDTLKAMRYEISTDGAAKVFKGANDRDYMLFVTLRGGQSLDYQQPDSIFDLGIYVGEGRDWKLLKHIYAMTRYDMQETLEQAEKAIRKGDWTGLGLSINRVNDSLEEPPGFNPRDYFLDDTATFTVLDRMGFKKLPRDPKDMSGKQVWQRIQGSIRIDIEHFDDDANGTFVVGYVSDAQGRWERKEIDIPNKPRSLEQVINDVDAVCRGVYEGIEEPPADDFDPRQYFIDSSSVSFNLEGKRETWNFGAESQKEIQLHAGAVALRLKYLADEWHPRWEFEVHVNMPWRGQFDKLLIKRTCESERLLPKRIEQVLAKAEEWWEKNKWGLKLYREMRDIHDNHADEWSEFLETHAGDLPTDYGEQTEETAAAWKHLMDEFLTDRQYGLRQESEDFDPRDYLLADKGTALVGRMKEFGYKQVYLNVMTDRHATLSMNDPNPEYEDEEEGGGIDQTKRVYTRNRVKTAVRELMGLATEVYDFSGDGGTDYLFKIADPEHMGIQGRFEAEDTFDAREYLATTPQYDEKWVVNWLDNEGQLRCTRPFKSAKDAMRFVYTASLWNKAEDVYIERSMEGQDEHFRSYAVTRDYELIDPDTGNILIREALVVESENQDFSARDYLLAPDDEHGLMFLDWLEAIGFDARGENTFELNQWGTRYIVQRYKNGKYRYAIYDPDGHKVRGQLVNRPGQLVDLLQQHLGMKLKENEEPFDAREWLTRDPDDAVVKWMEAQGFSKVREATFYTVWSRVIGTYMIQVYKGQKDDRLGSSRWWLEIWEQKVEDEFGTKGWHNTSPGMGAYWSAENFMPRLRRAQEIRQMWASDDKLMAR